MLLRCVRLSAVLEQRCLACFYGESLYGFDAYELPNTGGEFGLPDGRGVYPNDNLKNFMHKFGEASV